MTLPIDIAVLKLLSNRSTYEQYIDFVLPRCFEQEIQLILQGYRKYYKEFNLDKIEIPDYASWFFHVVHPDLPESKREIYTAIFNRINESGDLVANQILIKLQELQTAHKLREIIDEKFDFEKLSRALHEHETALQLGFDDDGDLIKADLTKILEETDKTKGLKWRLDCLNAAIGSVSRGMLIIVAAYVDVGKTMFAISESTFMAKQLTEGCILWLNNEEDDYRVLRKIWKSVLSCDDADLLVHRKDAEKEYIKRLNGEIDRIKFINIRSKSLGQIKQLFKKYDARLCIIDQVDKIVQPRVKSFSDHDRLKSLYSEIRDLANKYCPIIAVSQADVTTTWISKDTQELMYQLYPHHRQLDGSKVGKPGEADVIIMIGKRGEYNTTRGIHVSKNKFGDTIKQEVLFKPELAQYRNPHHDD